MIRLGALLTSLFLPMASQAAVVTYNSATNFPHIEAGYTTTASGGTANFGGCLPPCVNNGTRNVFSNGADITIAGSSFNLLSFEAGELFQGAPQTWASSILVTGTYSGGGTVAQLFAIDGIHDGPGGVQDFQVFVLGSGFTNLSSVVFEGVSGAFGSGIGFTLDNVTLEAAGAVPEPATLGLFGVAIAALGWSARRERSARLRAQA